jgi:hypothetical protein
MRTEADEILKNSEAGAVVEKTAMRRPAKLPKPAHWHEMNRMKID